MTGNFNKIFVLKDLSDDTTLKVKVCKTKASLKYNCGFESYKYKVANTDFVYDADELLGEHGDIFYISDQAPLAKCVADKKIGDTFKIAIDNSRICGYQLIDFYEIDENGNKLAFSREIEYLKKRGVATLIHFTRIENVENIMKYGICSLNECQKIGVEPLVTDEQRLDNLKDYSSFSIGFPNYKMRYQKEKELNYRFAIIVINIDAIYNVPGENIIYSYCNAASSGYHNAKSLTGVKSLFYDEKLRVKLKLPDHYPTNPQAEVLIKGKIDSKYFKYIFVASEEEYQYLKSKNIDSVVDNLVFSPRHDYEYWKKNAEAQNG